MPHLFFQIAAVLVLATVLGILARGLKQPLIVAYIFTGVVVSYLGLFREVSQGVFDLLSNFGIAFLLFLVGIDLRIEDLKYVGRAAIYTGLGQILFTTLVGFVVVSALGFSVISAFYISFAMTFSSTVIIVKLLAEKNDLQSLHGKIAVGFLLVQDFVAILTLMILSGFGKGGQLPGFGETLLIFGKGAVLIVVTYVVSKYALRSIFRLVSTSVELLFVAAISWAFIMSALAEQVGFSVAIGAFLAGVAIAASPYRIQISGRVKPLRDFFVVVFFILLGLTLSKGTAGLVPSRIIILSVFILIGNPLIAMAIMMTLKFRNRTAFLASVTVAQVSEFSLILMATGARLGQVTSSDVSLVAAVAITTITLSSYLILYGDKIYKYISGPMARLFPEKQHDPYVTHRENLKDHVVLVGGEQMGWDILDFLKGKISDKDQIVVVDFNPQIFNSLKASGFNAVFGDISDPEVLEELELGRARLLIITDPDISDSHQIITFSKEKNYKGPIIGTAYWIHDAVKLYEMGADYVVVPEEVGGKHIARILSEHWDNLAKMKKLKSRRFEELLTHKIF